MERSNLGQQETPIRWGLEGSEVITLTWGIFQTRIEVTSSWAAPSIFVDCGGPTSPIVTSEELHETAPKSCWFKLPTPNIELTRDNDGLVVASTEKPPAPLAVNLGRYGQPLESLSFSEDSFRIPNQGLAKVDSVNILARGANVNSNLPKINDSGWFDPRRKTNLPFLKNSR